MKVRIITYQRYITEDTNDPEEAMLAKSLGPLVTDSMGETRRVVTGDMVDGEEIKLMGEWRAEVKKTRKFPLPVKAEQELRKLLGNAYFMFGNNNVMRQQMGRAIAEKGWPAVLQGLKDSSRKMRPYSAVFLLCSSYDTEQKETLSGKMTEAQAIELGLK